MSEGALTGEVVDTPHERGSATTTLVSREEERWPAQKVPDATTREKMDQFLAGYRTGLTVGDAIRAAGMERSSIARWRRTYAGFLQEFEEAQEDSTEILEAEAIRRAVSGVSEPVYQGGVQVGTIQRYSDHLLMFLLKARRPGVYRDRVDVTSGDAPIKVYTGINIDLV